MRRVRSTIAAPPRRRRTSRPGAPGGEDARVERRRHQHGDAAPLRSRQERVERGVVEQRVAAGQHEAVEVAVAREALRMAQSLTPTPNALMAGRAQVRQRAVRALHRLAIALLEQIALPARLTSWISTMSIAFVPSAAGCLERAQRAVA
jgi:hypothetical protein